MEPGETVGILVHGDNHFIVAGPLPDRSTALELARHWSLIRIDQCTPAELGQWKIRNRAFRENLSWAVIVAADAPPSAAVRQLLSELAGRGVRICDAGTETW